MMMNFLWWTKYDFQVRGSYIFNQKMQFDEAFKKIQHFAKYSLEKGARINIYVQSSSFNTDDRRINKIEKIFIVRKICDANRNMGKFDC